LQCSISDISELASLKRQVYVFFVMLLPESFMMTFAGVEARSPKIDVGASANLTSTFPTLRAHASKTSAARSRLAQHNSPRSRIHEAVNSSKMQARRLPLTASILLQQSARHWRPGRDPEDVEHAYMLWGMPKIVWVLIFDAMAVGLYVAGIKGATCLARQKRVAKPPDVVDIPQDIFPNQKSRSSEKSQGSETT